MKLFAAWIRWSTKHEKENVQCKPTPSQQNHWQDLQEVERLRLESFQQLNRLAQGQSQMKPVQTATLAPLLSRASQQLAQPLIQNYLRSVNDKPQKIIFE